MLAILNITLPIFILMGLGYFVLRFSLFNREHIAGVGQFLLRIGMPALVFNSISSRPFHQIIQIQYLAGYTIASVLSFGIIYVLSRQLGQAQKFAALNALAGGMANSGFVGYPLLSMATNPQTASTYFAMNVLTENVLILPLLFILLQWEDNRGNLSQSLGKIGINLLKSPIILALLAGLPFAFGWLPLPIFVQKTASMLAQATAPLALFVIGASLYGMHIQAKWRDIIGTGLGKILLMPILVHIMLRLLNAPYDALMIGTLFACAPAPSLYALFGRQHGFEHETAATLLFTTIGSFIPIALVLAWWQH